MINACCRLLDFVRERARLDLLENGRNPCMIMVITRMMVVVRLVMVGDVMSVCVRMVTRV